MRFSDAKLQELRRENLATVDRLDLQTKERTEAIRGLRHQLCLPPLLHLARGLPLAVAPGAGEFDALVHCRLATRIGLGDRVQGLFTRSTGIVVALERAHAHVRLDNGTLHRFGAGGRSIELAALK